MNETKAEGVGRLYVVATPIGNLGDLSTRAVEVLGSVSAVYCEDTRRARVLWQHAGLTTPLVALPAPREAATIPRIIGRLRVGEDLALISDAGTPLLSDPGNRLLSAAWENEIPVTPIPGASALTALLSVCPLPVDRFQFVGFPPKKGKTRSEWLQSISSYGGTTFFYLAGRDLDRMLNLLAPEPGRARVFIGRELTKLHEELCSGDAATTRPRDLRGEFVLGLRFNDSGKKDPARAEGSRRHLEFLLRRGLGASEAARALAELLRVPKRDLYSMALEIAEGQARKEIPPDEDEDREDPEPGDGDASP